MGSHIHIMGVAYKKDIDDLRESPSLDIMHLLKRRGAKLTYTDAHIPALRVDGLNMCSTPMETMAELADCVLVLTDHSKVDYKALVERANLVVDTRNALKGISSEKIVRL